MKGQYVSEEFEVLQCKRSYGQFLKHKFLPILLISLTFNIEQAGDYRKNGKVMTP